MPSIKTRVELLFGGRCKRPPSGIHVAPGRAVLLGGHLEAAAGPLLAAPLAEGVACAWGLRPDSRVVVWSMNARQKDSFHHGQIARCGRPWSDLARGACARVADGGRRLPGIDLMVYGDLPPGEGLAASAAYLTVILRSLHDAVGSYRSKWELAEDIPAIERDWADRTSDPADAFVVAAAKSDRGVLLVEREGLEHRALTLPAGTEVVTEASGVPAMARDPGRDAARAGIVVAWEGLQAAAPDARRLADLDAERLDALADTLDADLLARARHLVEESTRIREAVAALEGGAAEGAARLGRLMTAGQRSMAAALDLSTPELDSLIDLALTRPGVLGARVQGRGRGGRLALLRETPDLR